MPLIGWVDTDSPDLLELWPESANIDQQTRDRLLRAAHEQCSAYAPVLPVGAPIPDRWPFAQILQAGEIYSAASRDGDVIGFSDQVAIRVRPLGNDVRALLRPRRGVPGLH